MWMERLAWSGKKGFNAEKLSEWKVDGKVAGSYKSYENLSVSLAIAENFVLIYQLLKVFYAGHM